MADPYVSARFVDVGEHRSASALGVAANHRIEYRSMALQCRSGPHIADRPASRFVQKFGKSFQEHPEDRIAGRCRENIVEAPIGQNLLVEIGRVAKVNQRCNNFSQSLGAAGRAAKKTTSDSRGRRTSRSCPHRKSTSQQQQPNAIDHSRRIHRVTRCFRP